MLKEKSYWSQGYRKRVIDRKKEDESKNREQLIGRRGEKERDYILIEYIGRSVILVTKKRGVCVCIYNIRGREREREVGRLS